MVCQACYQAGNQQGQFCSGCGQSFAQAAYAPLRGRLSRPRQGRVIAGVCAGFAREYGWDPIVVRLVLCALVLFGCGSGILAYFIAWMVMPNGPYLYPFQNYPQTPAGAQPAA